jgi:hypothetical protein
MSQPHLKTFARTALLTALLALAPLDAGAQTAGGGGGTGGTTATDTRRDDGRSNWGWLGLLGLLGLAGLAKGRRHDDRGGARHV